MTLVEEVNQSKQSGMMLLYCTILFALIALSISFPFIAKTDDRTSAALLVFFAFLAIVFLGWLGWCIFRDFQTVFSEEGIEQGKLFIRWDEMETVTLVRGMMLDVCSKSSEKIRFTVLFHRDPRMVMKLVTTKVGDTTRLLVK